MTAKEHNKLVGIFLMAHGGLQMVAIVIIAVIYGVIGSAMLVGARKGEEQMVGAIFIGMIALLVIAAAVFALPQFIAGYKLWKERANARTWGLAASIISCLSFPVGTAVGVYGLWFLFGDMGKQLYLGGMTQNQNLFQNQPPPSSWQ